LLLQWAHGSWRWNHHPEPFYANYNGFSAASELM
jgi:hypothetical protein